MLYNDMKIFNIISRKHRGFTAIELIVVLAIIGILVTVSVPTISRFLPGVQLTGTTRVLTGTLREAQEKAVTSQNQYLVRFFPTNSPAKYQLVEVVNSTETLIRETNLPFNETLAIENTITSDQIIFSPDGGPSSTGSITLTIDGKSKIISVSPAGFIKINN